MPESGSFRKALKRRQARFESSFRAYAARRGFSSINDAPFAWRAFVSCWAEPGFHRFWRVWNPGISYFVHRAYVRLGGRKRWVFATLASFELCGLAHNAVALPFFGRWWSWTLPVAFLCFGIFTVLSRLLEAHLRQDRWPMPVNVTLNVLLVILGMDVGFRVEAILPTWS
jgi:hypothetical protein